MITKIWMFLISFLSVFVSSYLIAGMFQSKSLKYKNSSFLILLLMMFAQVVFTFEVLSLFQGINSTNVLISNFLILAGSVLVFVNQKAELYKPQPVNFLKKVWKGLRKDKFLLIMSFGLLFMLFVTIIFNIFLPITNFDALSYHLNRVAFWLSQGSLNHFDISDDRNLVMPINSEILYLWVLTFLKNDIGLQFFSCVGYLMCSFSIYNVLQYFGYSERKKLWSVLIFSSFASVIAELTSIETDILIAGLILSSIYLFLVALKEKTFSMMFFSSLAYALAIGTKSPAVIAFPAVFIMLVFFAYKADRKNSYKPLGLFLGLLFLNFVLFAGYNYILNFIHYGDFLGSESAKAVHGFRGGIKAAVANYIRYIFMMFDFSGFRYSEYLGEYIINARSAIFDFLHIPYELGVEMSDNNLVNNSLLEIKMGTGLLGLLLFLPSVIGAVVLGFIKKIQKFDSQKTAVLFIFGLTFFINILCLSFSIAYMVFSVRFVTTMVIISTPVLVLSYIRKNILMKLVVLFFVMSYFLLIPLNLPNRNAKASLIVFLQEQTVMKARERIRCSANRNFTGIMPFCYIRNVIKTTPKGTRYGILPSNNSRLYPIKMLDNEGYKIDILLPEKFDDYDLSQYDYLIKTDNVLISSVLLNKTKDIKITYKVGEDNKPYLINDENRFCTYLVHGTYKVYNPEKTNNKERVVASFCVITDDYMKENGFEQLRVYNFMGIDSSHSNYMTIYKKINN